MRDGTPESRERPRWAKALEKRTRRVIEEIDTLDRAIHDAVASTPTPTLDKPLAQISHAANYSRLWLAIAAALAVVGGHRGRQAAMRGLTAVGASSVTANLVAKQVVPRSRPEQIPFTVRSQSRAPMSSSFPSGHTASAFAFATAATADVPGFALPLYGLATIVGYSRVHTGAHYPSDVLGGGVLGLTIGTVVREASVRMGPSLRHRALAIGLQRRAWPPRDQQSD